MSKCSFCGEKEGIKVITDPNLALDSIEYKTWKVCSGCAKFIRQTQCDDACLSVVVSTKDKKMRTHFLNAIKSKSMKELAEKLIKERGGR